MAVRGTPTGGSKILAACRGKVLTAFGYTWSLSAGGCPQYENPMARSNQAKLKPIFCSNGMEFASRLDAIAWGRPLGLRLSNSRLNRCIKFPASKSGGLYWRNHQESPK
jgi:hypothetical protein